MNYASLATNIVGTELQGWAALLAKWEMADAYEKELKRQEAFKKAATEEFNMRLGFAGAETANAQMAEGAAARMAAYDKIGSIPLATTGPSGSDSQRLAASAKLMGAPRAKLGGYSDWGLKQAIANINTQRALDAITDQAGGQARVFPYRMYDAQHSWDTLGQVGAAISSLGGGDSNYQAPSQPSGYWNMGGGNSFNQGYFTPGDYNASPAIDPYTGYPVNQQQFASNYNLGGGWVMG